MDMATEPLAVVRTDETNGVITYEVTVPPELDAVAVLDASFRIRELCRMDPRMSQLPGAMHDSR